MFLSSHLLGEVELICTRAAMMAHGRLVAQDSIERLLAPTGRLRDRHARHRRPSAVLAAAGRRRADRRHRATASGSSSNGLPPEQLNQALVHAGVRVRELVVERRSLEDAYLGLTGGSGDARR